MSLDVTAREQERRFDVYVGQKHVGFVKAFRSGYCEAYRIRDGETKYIHREGRSPHSLKDAVRQILEDAGFGRPDGFVRDAQRRVP